MSFTFYDLEYIIIYSFLLVMFIASLKKKACCRFDSGGGSFSSAIDLNMSNAMKGIACVMILTAHWGQRRFNIDMPWGISKAVWHFSATIALVWFMFFSGYGLSLKVMKRDKKILPIWLKRLKKVYLPLLFVCIVCTLCYMIVPDRYSPEQLDSLWIPSDVYYLHHLSWENLKMVWPHVFGWKDWYVLCIMMFYSLFYLSLWLERKTTYSQTTWLFLLMCLYYVWAFWVFGRPEGHFFRYCWCFFISHVVAKWSTYKDKRWPVLFSICLGVTLLMEGKIMLLGAFVAVASIAVVSIINVRYEIQGKPILFLGSISYFFYLLHCRISYPLIVYLDINSIIAWALLTAIMSWGCYRMYNQLTS